MEQILLFTYGTLRVGGPANFLLNDAELIGMDLRLSGYKMYNAGHYPFVVAADYYTSILGDLFRVDKKMLDVLDEYEGEEYIRSFDKVMSCYIYINKEIPANLPEVSRGDWLEYSKKHNIDFRSF